MSAPTTVRAPTEGDLLLPRGASAGIPVQLLSPEGVPLTFLLARGWDRVAAFVLDALLLTAGFLGIGILLALTWTEHASGAWFPPLVVLGVFFLRNFYFTWFECRRQGATPGKRRLRLRVVSSAGGALTTEAVFARNLMREVELWLPIGLLASPESLWPDAPGGVRLLAALWTLVLAGFPLLNRRRLRLGDLVAGTMVVVRPRAVLLGDVGTSTRPSAAGARPPPEAATAPSSSATLEPTYRFTDAQLDVYGNYELQVLEEVLRRSRATPHDQERLEAVARKIRAKLGWAGPVERNQEPFLRAYYAALRARLEHRMLLGKGKADKHVK